MTGARKRSSRLQIKKTVTAGSNDAHTMGSIPVQLETSARIAMGVYLFLFVPLYLAATWLFISNRHKHPVDYKQPYLTLATHWSISGSIFTEILPSCFGIDLDCSLYRPLASVFLSLMGTAVILRGGLLYWKYLGTEHQLRAGGARSDVTQTAHETRRYRLGSFVLARRHWARTPPLILTHLAASGTLTLLQLLLTLLTGRSVSNENCFTSIQSIPTLAALGLILISALFLLFLVWPVRENLGLRIDSVMAISLLTLTVAILAVVAAYPPLVDIEYEKAPLAGITIMVIQLALFLRTIAQPVYQAIYKQARWGETSLQQAVSSDRARPAEAHQTLTLQQVLKDSTEFLKLREFLAKEFCVELPLFYQSVEEYKQICAAEDLSPKLAKIKDIACLYLLPDAKLQVNLTQTELSSTLQNIGYVEGELRSDAAERASLNAFEPAQNAVLKLMKVNAWARFQETNWPNRPLAR